MERSSKSLRLLAVACCVIAAVADADADAGLVGNPAAQHDQHAGAGSPTSERIYFAAWNLGAACGTNELPGCRDAAVNFLTNVTNFGYQPTEAGIFVTTGLVEDDGSPVDLTSKNQLAGQNYTRVDGVCRTRYPSPSQRKQDNVAITLRHDFQIVQSGGGCLDGRPGADPFAFAVALVKPINNRCYDSSAEVVNCPDGVCIIGVHAPVKGISKGADIVAEVCGLARHRCSVAVGDWNLGGSARGPGGGDAHTGGSGPTVEKLWHQLTGDKMNKTKLFTTGVDHAQATTNVVGVHSAMNVGEGDPLSKQYPNATGQGPLQIIDLLLPC